MTDLLGIRYPIIQAGMSRASSSAPLAAAVSKAGGLGVIAAGPIYPAALRAAMLCLGDEAVQMGTRFLLTPEASLHPAYKDKVLAAGIGDTTLVGWRGLPIRAVRNAFTDEYEAAERAGQSREALEALFGSRSLKMAALDGDVERGKVEAGQSAALIDALVPAAELVARIASELDATLHRLHAMRVPQ